MKILNLYSGIGGNRKLWSDEHEITAIEINKKIATKYKSLFPNDKVIITDAHEYLLEHYKEYDFIWTSPPCQTHSKTNYFTQHIRKIPVYPDMKLYQQIIFLDAMFKGKYVVENVVSYYEPLIKPTKIGRHYFWSNFNIPKIKQAKNDIGTMDCKYGNKACKKPIEERNSVNSELGLHILNRALNIVINETINQKTIFDEP